MIPRLDIRFPLKRQWQYWFGDPYEPRDGEYLLNHARTGIVLALRASFPNGGRVGVVAYNCHTVSNAVVNGGCKPVFVDITDELKINISDLPQDLDAIVVTNLFGIRNDIDAIRKQCPNAVIIVDNAHGYGLPTEGDFTVYSINQGKFPSLGEGGILIVNHASPHVQASLEQSYRQLPCYNRLAQVKLFLRMWLKALLYSPMLYRLVRLGKKTLSVNPKEPIVMRQMASGVRRMYDAFVACGGHQVERQRKNAKNISRLLQGNETVDKVIYGENAFMAIAKCTNPTLLKEWFAGRGVETDTHFHHAIDWAKSFGYIPGSCPKTEELTKHLLMIPTYKTL